jgi:hypothetical protein
VEVLPLVQFLLSHLGGITQGRAAKPDCGCRVDRNTVDSFEVRRDTMHQAYRVATVVGLTLIGIPLTSFAHSPYGKALKGHYELQAVTCYACHQKGKDEQTGKPLGKEHLNNLGEALHELLKEHNFTEQFEAAKKGSADERKKLTATAEDEFLKAYGKLANEPVDSDRTWADLITSGEHEGVRLKK